MYLLPGRQLYYNYKKIHEVNLIKSIGLFPDDSSCRVIFKESRDEQDKMLSVENVMVLIIIG